MHTPTNPTALADLLAVMHRLRQECPWDKQQTPQSLTRYAIEEAYEVEEAIASGDIEHIKEELGDLLLQVVFQCELYAEQGQFSFYDVMETLQHKLIRRHPHVFAPEAPHAPSLDTDTLHQQWQRIKAEEKEEREKRKEKKETATTPAFLLDHIKPGSALMQSEHMQKTVAHVGFDWPNVQGALDKLHEEIAELYAELPPDIEQQQTPTDAIVDEYGDMLFVMVNIGRKLNIRAELALLHACRKFKRRFNALEQLSREDNTPLSSLSLEAMETLWQRVKQAEKTQT